MMRVVLPAVGAALLLAGAQTAMADDPSIASTPQLDYYLDDGQYRPAIPGLTPTWHEETPILRESEETRYFMPKSTPERRLFGAVPPQAALHDETTSMAFAEGQGTVR